MELVSNLTKLLILGVTIIGTVALILLIVGVATQNWVTVSSSSSLLEARLDQVLRNASFIGPLIAQTEANLTQIGTIIGATVAKVKEELSSGVGKTTYHLFDKTPNLVNTPPDFKFPQGLVIAGLISVFVGVVLAVIIGMLGLWTSCDN